MKLKIENEKAKSANFTEAFKTPLLKDGFVQLGFTLPEQELNRWCWAAIAVAAADYYHQESIRQAELVTKVLGFDCINAPSDSTLQEKCNVNHTLDIALKTVNTFSHWSFGKPQLDRIQHEINHGNPIALRVEWFNGGGHYVVAKGYHPTTKQIQIEDPMHGPALVDFEIFPRQYQEMGGIWTECFWMTKGTK